MVASGGRPRHTPRRCSDSRLQLTMLKPTQLLSSRHLTATPTVLIRPAETHLHSHTHPLSNIRTNRHSRARAYVDAYPFTYRDTDAYRDAFTNPYACRYRDSFANTNTNTNTNTDGHLGSLPQHPPIHRRLYQLRLPHRRPPWFPPQRLPIHRLLCQLRHQHPQKLPQQLPQQLRQLPQHLNRQPRSAQHHHQLQPLHRRHQAMSIVPPISPQRPAAMVKSTSRGSRPQEMSTLDISVVNQTVRWRIAGRD